MKQEVDDPMTGVVWESIVELSSDEEIDAEIKSEVVQVKDHYLSRLSRKSDYSLRFPYESSLAKDPSRGAGVSRWMDFDEEEEYNKGYFCTWLSVVEQDWLLVEWKWGDEPFLEVKDHTLVEDWETGSWSSSPRILDMCGADIHPQLLLVDTSCGRVEAESQNKEIIKCFEGIFEHANDDPKKMQTNQKRRRQDYHRVRNRSIKVGSFNMEGITPPLSHKGELVQGEYSGRLLEAIEYGKNRHLDCLCLQETYNMEDGGYRTAYGWMLYYAGNGMSQGEKSGVAILVPPRRQQYLKDVIVQSYRLMAAVFVVTGGELAVITYHTPWDLKDYNTERKMKAEEVNNLINPEQSDQFFKDLNDLDDKIGSYPMKILIGDANLRLHARQPGEQNVLGSYIWGAGQKVLNDIMHDRAKRRQQSNRERWLKFAVSKQYLNLNTCYRHKPQHTVTYREPGIENRYDLQKLRRRGIRCRFSDPQAQAAEVVKCETKGMQDQSCEVTYFAYDSVVDNVKDRKKLGLFRVTRAELEDWSRKAWAENLTVSDNSISIGAKAWADLLLRPYHYAVEHWQVLDHVWTTKKWKHGIRNVVSDATANLRGQHHPIEVHFSLSLPKLKKPTKPGTEPGTWNRVALQDPKIRKAIRDKVAEIVVPKMKALEEELSKIEPSQPTVTQLYQEVIDAGNEVPELVISPTLPRPKNQFHSVRTMRLIEGRGKLQKYSIEWYEMSRAVNKSSKSDRRRGKRRGLGVAEWRQIRNATRGFQPFTLILKDEKGVKVPHSQVADTMASQYEK